jgi:hypothetical protein
MFEPEEAADASQQLIYLDGLANEIVSAQV